MIKRLNRNARKKLFQSTCKDAYISEDQLVIILEVFKKEFNITKFIGDVHYDQQSLCNGVEKWQAIEALQKIRNRKILSRR